MTAPRRPDPDPLGRRDLDYGESRWAVNYPALTGLLLFMVGVLVLSGLLAVLAGAPPWAVIVGCVGLFLIVVGVACVDAAVKADKTKGQDG